MLLFESLDAIRLPSEAASFVAVGTFDGVHRGHQELLTRAAALAREHGALMAVFTFQNHPRSIVDPAGAPSLLTPWPQKRELLARLPLDVITAVPFTAEFAAQEPEDFVRRVLLGQLRARVITSGPAFHFGRQGRGNSTLLQQMAATEGFRYEPCEPLLSGADRISSTRIRQALLEGDVAGAANLLGRFHTIEAPVVPGDRLGRTIGFPTANLAVAKEALLPRDGVYAAWATLPDQTRVPAMMNLGHRPTVEGREHRVEAHLLDWSCELEGQTLRLEFAQRLRDEQRFPSLDALKEQLHHDREAALAALAQVPAEGP